MLGMLETDTTIHDPIALFLSKLDAKLPGKTRKLHERVDEDVISDAKAWLLEFTPLALKEKRANDADRVSERHEAVFKETHLLVTEMRHYILAGIARHPDFEDKLKPRMGKTPAEYIENLVDMRQRLTEHAKEMTEREIVVKLDPRHSAAAVAVQATLHLQAQTALDLLGKTENSHQDRLVALRKEGKLLQTRINKQVVAAIPGNRSEQVLHGYTERESSRSNTGEKEKLEREKLEKEKLEKEKLEKLEKKTAAPAPANPPTPGPVASGTSAPLAAGETTTAAPAPDHSAPPPDAKLDR